MPYLNREAVIKETIESVLAQTYTNWELIAVDDGSSDSSSEILEQISQRDSRIKLYKRATALNGPSVCRNLGVNYSSGEYLIFLDSDDILLEDCCEKRVRIMDSNPKLDFAVFNLGLFKKEIGDTNGCFNKVAQSAEDYLKLFLKLQTPWQTTCPIWRRSFFLKVSGFNEGFLVKTDPELHTRVLLLHQPIFHHFYNEPVDCFYRIDHMDLTKSRYFNQASIVYRVKFFKEIVGYIQKSNYYSIKNLRPALQSGILAFFKDLFVNEVVRCPKEFFDFLNWSRSNLLIGPKNYAVLYLLGKTKIHNGTLLKRVHLAGVLYKLL